MFSYARGDIAAEDRAEEPDQNLHCVKWRVFVNQRRYCGAIQALAPKIESVNHEDDKRERENIGSYEITNAAEQDSFDRYLHELGKSIQFYKNPPAMSGPPPTCEGRERHARLY